MPDNGVRTTETSQTEGRLKVGVGCGHGKKGRCLKCAIKDGKGGSGYNPPGFGATFAQGSIKLKMPSLTSGKKISKLKKLKSFSSKKIKKTKISNSYKKTKTSLLKGLLKKVKVK